MTMMQYLGRIQFDFGARRHLVEELARAGITRPLVVSDRGVDSSGVLGSALEEVHDAAAYPRFLDVPSNPTETATLGALAVYREEKCDGILAIGGGSPMDCAKGVGLLATHPGTLADYLARTGGSDQIGPIAPLVAVPTTAGTGSEVGRGAGITLSDGEKGVFLSPHLVPRAAICDPELTLALPAGLTAATGVDAFTHAFESFVSPAINPPADALALDALARLFEWLPRAARNGSDREARWQVMMGAVEATMATWKGLGGAHALSMPFDDLGLHHGTLVGLLLPHTVPFVLEAVDEARIARLVERIDSSPGRLANDLADFGTTIGLPGSLSELDVPREFLARASFVAESTPFNRTTPRAFTADEYLTMATAAW